MAHAALIESHCCVGAAFVGKRREKTREASDGEDEGENGGGDEGRGTGAQQVEYLHLAGADLLAPPSFVIDRRLVVEHV